MTKMLARQAQDGLTLEAMDLTFADLQAAYPDRMFSRALIAAQFDGTPFVSIDVPDRPALNFDERAVRVVEKIGGQWVASWTVEPRATVAEIKTELRNMAMSMAHRKLYDWVPTAAQWHAAGRSMLAAQTARAGQVDTKLIQVLTDIQAASTAAEAFAIYQQLVDVA